MQGDQTPSRDDAASDRLESGVPRLDQILGGGLPRRSLAMIVGPPGAGKTMLAQQLAFHHARTSRALYLSGYAETHDQLLAHARGLSFFEPQIIGRALQLVSLLDLLEQGADETRKAIGRMVHEQGISLVVVDGFAGMHHLLGGHESTPHFLYQLGAQLALLGATTLVLLEDDADLLSRYTELSVADTVIALQHHRYAGRARRLLMVMKERGAQPLEGAHPFTISTDGVTLFPRLESMVTVEPEAAWSSARSAFGVDGLDRMLGGGPNVGTTTLAAGTPGVGKTLLALHFAAEGARRGEPVLFVGFLESAAQLRQQARVFGLDVLAAEAAGTLRLLVLPAFDLEADRAAQLIVEDVQRRQVRRLVIDSLAELDHGIGDPDRRAGFFSALVAHLRGHQVSTYATLDISSIAGPELNLADTPLSVLAENLLLLRTVEYRATLHRVVSVLKMRFSAHERAIFEYAVDSGRGVHLLGPAPLGEGLLTGIARPLGDGPQPR